MSNAAVPSRVNSHQPQQVSFVPTVPAIQSRGLRRPMEVRGKRGGRGNEPSARDGSTNSAIAAPRSRISLADGWITGVQEVCIPRSKQTPGAEPLIYSKEFLMNFKDVRRPPSPDVPTPRADNESVAGARTDGTRSDQPNADVYRRRGRVAEVRVATRGAAGLHDRDRAGGARSRAAVVHALLSPPVTPRECQSHVG